MINPVIDSEMPYSSMNHLRSRPGGFGATGGSAFGGAAGGLGGGNAFGGSGFNGMYSVYTKFVALNIVACVEALMYVLRFSRSNSAVIFLRGVMY